MDNIRPRKVKRKVVTIDKKGEPKVVTTLLRVQGPTGLVPTTFLSGAFNAAGDVLGVNNEPPKEGDALIDVAIATFPFNSVLSKGMTLLPRSVNQNFPNFVRRSAMSTYLNEHPSLFKVKTPEISIRPELTLYQPFKYSIGHLLNKDKYLTNGLWNIPIILQELKSGKDKAISYFNSELRNTVNLYNTKEAHSLGFVDFSPNINSGNRVATPLNSKLVADPNTSYLARITSPSGNASTDFLEVNLVNDDIENSVFHELLHRGSLGYAEPIRAGESFLDFVKRVKGTNKYYDYKTLKLLKDRSEISENLKEGYDYVSDSHEAAANYFELGLRLGLEPGSLIPDDNTLKLLISNWKLDSRIASKNGLLEFIQETPEGRKNLFKAMTGKYYLIPIAYGTTIGNYEN